MTELGKQINLRLPIEHDAAYSEAVGENKGILSRWFVLSAALSEGILIAKEGVSLPWRVIGADGGIDYQIAVSAEAAQISAEREGVEVLRAERGWHDANAAANPVIESPTEQSLAAITDKLEPVETEPEYRLSMPPIA